MVVDIACKMAKINALALQEYEAVVWRRRKKFQRKCDKILRQIFDAVTY